MSFRKQNHQTANERKNCEITMNNDQEWRAHLFDEIKELRKDVAEVKSEMMTLKLKVAGFSSFVGAIISYIGNKLL